MKKGTSDCSLVRMKININQNIPNHILAHGLNDEDHVPGEVKVRPLELLSVTLPLLLTGCTVEIFSLENNIKKCHEN